MLGTIQFRRGTSAQWIAKDPVLGQGEPGFESDSKKIKIGDGINRWSLLPYFLNDVQAAAMTQAMIEEALENSGGGDGDIRIGNMADLTTIVKSTVVGSINEVNTPPVAFTLLYENAKAG